jgi:hypothetical protein
MFDVEEEFARPCIWQVFLLNAHHPRSAMAARTSPKFLVPFAGDKHKRKW